MTRAVMMTAQDIGLLRVRLCCCADSF